MQGVALVHWWSFGCESTIGAATARKFLLKGVDKVTIADFNASLLASYAKELEAEFPDAQILPIVTNVADEKDVKKMVDETVAKFGRLDYCANCAGISMVHPINEFETASWDKVIGVNQNGVFFALREEIAQMQKQDLVPHPGRERGARRGAIVSIASIAGLRAMPNSAAYVASKHAVIGLTKTAAVENGPKGIRVNCVAPGIIITPLTKAANEVHPQFLAMATSTMATPLSRGGQPEEVADVIVFLCSDEASFVSGSTWEIDGAMTAK